jgi:hypothetical protein
MSEIEKYDGGGMLDPVTDSWTSVVDNVAQFAGQIANTEFVPTALRGRDNGAKVAAAILTGRELGLPPMTSLASIHVINGKPGISAEMMRALVLQAGHQIQVTESTSVKVVIKGRRDGDEEWTTVEWSEQDSRRAGILSGNHVKYPRQMFAARATTELCRLLFADVIHGLRSIEELEDLGAEQLDVMPERGSEEPAKPALTRKRREPKTQPVDAEKDAPSGEPAQRRKPGLTRRGGATSQTAAGSDAGHPGAGEAPDDATDPAAPASDAAVKTVRNLFDELLYPTGDRAGITNEVVGREVTKLADLTQDEVNGLIEVLEQRVAAKNTPQTGGEPVERETSDGSSPPDDAPGVASAGPDDGGTPRAESGSAAPDDDGIVDAEIVDDEADAEPRISIAQRPKLMAQLGELDVKDKAERLSILSDLTGREIASTNELSVSEASSIIESLEQCDTRDDLEQVIRATVAHREGES